MKYKYRVLDKCYFVTGAGGGGTTVVLGGKPATVKNEVLKFKRKNLRSNQEFYR
jgi:hypothetical protein